MILVISDYHKQEEKVLNLISTINPTHIICCGDGESEMEFYTKNNIISVKGNCDYIDLPLLTMIEIEGKRILVTHGHWYNVYFDTFKLYMLGKEKGADVVLYGHTHNQMVEEYDGITFINPGALKDDNYALLDNFNVILR